MSIIKSSTSGSTTGIVTRDGHEISAEACQDMFQYFTRPKTSLSKDYSANVKLNFEEIENLNAMIGQTLRGENVVALNASVIVIHKDKSKAIFENFEAFRGYVTGGSSPTRLVILVYKYLLRSASTDQVQSYEIKIELNSKLAYYQLMDEDKLPSEMKSLLIRVMSTVELEIQYEDYLKAKVIVDLVDNWVSGCPTSDDWGTNFIKRLQNYSHVFASLFSCIAVLCLMFYLKDDVNDFIPKNSPVENYIIFLLQVLGLSYLIIMISRGVGKLVENFLDFYPFLSYIEINKGDTNLISKRKGTITAVILKIIGTIIVGAIGSYVMAVICGFYPSLLPSIS